MRSSTSFAILALFATAGTSVAAPIAARDAPVLSGSHDKGHSHKSPSLVNVDLGKSHKSKPAHENLNTSFKINGDVAIGEDKHHKSTKGRRNGGPIQVGPVPALDKPVTPKSANNVHPVTDTGKHGALDISPVTNDAHLKDDTVAILPNRPLVPGKDGVADVQQGNLAGHIIQTPGKDKTLVDVELGDGSAAHKTDTKVNFPVSGPFEPNGKGLIDPNSGGKGPKNDADFNGNIVNQLAGRPGKGQKDIIEAGPIAQVEKENERKPSSPSPKPSTANASKSSQSASTAARPSNNPSPSSAAAASSSASPPAESSAAPARSSPAPVQSSAAPQSSQPAKAQNDNDDGINISPGAFRAAHLPGGKMGDKSPVGSSSQPSMNKGGDNKLKNGDGQGVSVSGTEKGDLRHADLKFAQVEVTKLPEHAVACDEHHRGGKNELVNVCIMADLLAYAPKHTFRCPDDMQHGITIHEDTAHGTMNSKMSKEVAKYVRLCIDAGAL